MEKKELTEKQRQILTYIREESFTNGYQPSLREVAGYLGITVSAVRGHLLACEKKGFVEITGRGRGVKFLEHI